MDFGDSNKKTFITNKKKIRILFLLVKQTS